MKKKSSFIHFFLTILLISLLITPVLQVHSLPLLSHIFQKNTMQNNPPLDINSINPIDDAFHGSTPFPSCEWWYFDSMFEQNYSVHVGFRILTYRGINFLKPSINIYQNEKIIANETMILPPGSFDASTSQPRLLINDEEVMIFDYNHYKNTGEWRYNVSYNLNGVGVDLTFTSLTKGWKYITPHEGWTVAIPQGTVNGFLYVHNEKIAVDGRGYHDHNWNFSIQTPARGWSWYWGKITGETLNLAWADIKETGLLKQTFTEKLGVLNTQKNNFIVIDPNNISFSVESFVLKDNRYIPTVFHIDIDQGNLLVDVTLSATKIHRSDPTMMTMHYWRYFVKVNGVISYEDTIEHIDNKTQIMEYMRFI